MKKERHQYRQSGGAPDGRYVGTNWEPDVNITDKGAGRASAKKVVTLGVDYILAPELIDDIAASLRAGYEVRVCGETAGDEALRIYPCATGDGTSMYPSASTIGGFRAKTLADKRPRLLRRGEETTPEQERKRQRRKAAGVCESKVDRSVVCPNCGTAIRVGRDPDRNAHDD